MTRESRPAPRGPAHISATNLDRSRVRVGTPTTTDLADYVEHFRQRVLQDALNEATSSYWLKRAEMFEAVGNARCDEIARACRNRAELALLPDDRGPEAIVCELCQTPTSPWTCSCGETRIGDAA